MGNKVVSNSATLLKQNLAPLLKNEYIEEGSHKVWSDLKKAVRADNGNLIVTILEHASDGETPTNELHKLPVFCRRMFHLQELWLIAAENGYLNALRVLIDVFPDNRLLFNALVLAAGNHQHAVVELLMAQQFIAVDGESGPGQFDFRLLKDPVSWSYASFFMSNSHPHPMMAAVALMDVEMVQRLLQYGCPVMGRFHEPFPTLQPEYCSVLAWSLAASCCTKALFDVLLPHTEPAGLLECLRVCCSAGQIDWVKTLLESKPSLISDTSTGIIQIGTFTEPRSPLAESLRAGHLSLAKYLLDAGASPNKMWYEVRSPLSLMTHSKTASKAGAALLLQYGAIASSPMCETCRMQHQPRADSEPVDHKEILNVGGREQKLDPHAAESVNLELMTERLNFTTTKKAKSSITSDVTSISSEAMDLADDPVEIACRQQSIDFVRVLLEANACVHRPNLLHISAKGKGSVGLQIVQLLLEHQADPWQTTAGRYPVQEACQVSLPKVAEVLLNAMEKEEKSDLSVNSDLHLHVANNDTKHSDRASERSFQDSVPPSPSASGSNGGNSSGEGGSSDNSVMGGSTGGNTGGSSSSSGSGCNSSSGSSGTDSNSSNSNGINGKNSGSGIRSDSSSSLTIGASGREGRRSGARSSSRSRSRSREPPSRVCRQAASAPFLSTDSRLALTVGSTAVSTKSTTPTVPARSMETVLMDSLSNALGCISISCVELLLARKANVDGSKVVFVSALKTASITRQDQSKLTRLFRVLLAAKASPDLSQDRDVIYRASDKPTVLQSLLEAKAHVATVYGVDGEPAVKMDLLGKGFSDCLHPSVVPLIEHGFIHTWETEMWEQALFLCRSENKTSGKAKAAAEAFEKAFAKRRVTLGGFHQWMLDETRFPIDVMSITMAYICTNQKKMWRPGKLEPRHHVPVVYESFSSDSYDSVVREKLKREQEQQSSSSV